MFKFYGRGPRLRGVMGSRFKIYAYKGLGFTDVKLSGNHDNITSLVFKHSLPGDRMSHQHFSPPMVSPNVCPALFNLIHSWLHHGCPCIMHFLPNDCCYLLPPIMYTPTKALQEFRVQRLKAYGVCIRSSA